MTDIIRDIFKNKKVNVSKLAPFGFEQQGVRYGYSTLLSDSGFRLAVCVTEHGEISTEVIDLSTGEPYTLHLADGAVGSFVGNIKAQYEGTLAEIARQCFDPNVFKSAQANELIAYAREVYGDAPEFLWRKTPNNAILRRKDTGKWYGALLTVSKRRLGIESDDIAEILDLRIQPEELEALVDRKTYFPGYHMNKRHWYAIILDHSAATEEICRRIDESYVLAV